MKIAKDIIAAALVALCGAVVVHPALTEDYDLVILNGRVMDPGSPLRADWAVWRDSSAGLSIRHTGNKRCRSSTA